MFPTRTAGEKGRVGGPYGVRNCALAAGAVSRRFRPPHAASELRIRQTGKRTRMTPREIENGERIRRLGRLSYLRRSEPGRTAPMTRPRPQAACAKLANASVRIG